MLNAEFPLSHPAAALTGGVSANIDIALLDYRNFKEARKLIAGFEASASYQDYVDERQAWSVGLSSAGLRVNFSKIRVASFLSWRLHAGVEADARRLDDFAALVETFRRNPKTSVEGRLNERGQAPTAQTRLRRLEVPVSPLLYERWAACFEAEPQYILVDAYARLLMEMWAEHP
jgi:hypothetical protein